MIVKNRHITEKNEVVVGKERIEITENWNVKIWDGFCGKYYSRERSSYGSKKLQLYLNRRNSFKFWKRKTETKLNRLKHIFKYSKTSEEFFEKYIFSCKNS